MKTRIIAGGRTRNVEAHRKNAKFIVSLDGQEHEVSVSEVNGVLSLLVDGHSHEVFVGKGVGRDIVHVDGTAVDVELERPAWARKGDDRRSVGEGGGPQRVAAPMPGKIVKVLVKAGDRVEPRQGLVVVEAMKMENELRSRTAGTVTEVRAIEGSSVEAGAILIVVE